MVQPPSLIDRITLQWLDENYAEQNFVGSLKNLKKLNPRLHMRKSKNTMKTTLHFIKDTTTLANNFPNNPFLLNDLTMIKNTDMVFEDNIYWNLAQLLIIGEKKASIIPWRSTDNVKAANKR